MSNDNRIPGRSIRVEDELWDAAKEAVEWRGDGSVSNVIRRALVNYVRTTDKKRQEQEGK